MSISGLRQTVGRALLMTVYNRGGGLQQVMFTLCSVEHRRTQASELRRTVDARSTVDARVGQTLVHVITAPGT